MKAKFLLVEDERIVAHNLKQRLSTLGYDTSSIASSCSEALASIEHDKPDIVLMDIHIEGEIDGIETAKRIPQELNIPVIYLTAYSEEATLIRAAETKPYGYLVKPFSERELHATIKMALQRHTVEVALKVSEAELHRSREDFRFLFIRNPLPMWVFDVSTLQFLDVNDAALETYGFARNEMLAMTIADVRPKEDVSKMAEILRDRALDYLSAKNIRHIRKNGDVFEVDAFSYPLMFGERQARIVVVIDVSARNRAEEKLRQAQRLEAIGHLTGGVAHDFNNLLAVISANLEFLAVDLAENKAVRPMIADALAASRRGAMLTSRLLAFSRQQALEPQIVSPRLLLANLLTLLRRTVDESIEIKLETSSGEWPIFVDPNQLENAIVNLVVNARDALPNGGLVTIEASNHLVDSYAAQTSDVPAGEYVLLVVSDTGVGMAPEVLKRAFDPFFTTKPVGKGTGLGLSMVFGFLQQSGGQARVYSEIGHGTSVKLYFPRAKQGTATDGAKTPLPDVVADGGHGETILLVEDDAAVRRSVVAMLERLGYVTLEAEDGPSAMELLSGNPKIDLLLTDVVLPKGMAGPALAEVIKARMPTIKIVFMSGYTRDMMIHNGILDDGVHLVTKPFGVKDMNAKLREVLDGQ